MFMAKPVNLFRRRPALLLLWLSFCLLTGQTFPVTARASESRGIQFIGFSHFKQFIRSTGSNATIAVLTSPRITTRLAWNELVVSWNAQAPEGTYLVVEARGLRLGHPTKWYGMGLWSSDPTRYPRQSVLGQKDDRGKVDTDTLILHDKHDQVQVRLTLGGDFAQQPDLKFLGLCVSDSTATFPALPPNRKAWGRSLRVPELSQMAYENGGVICSPTALAMMLDYWSLRLDRPELSRPVPEIVAGVYDRNWQGTGNWVFNTAYAGSLDGIRAYVARMSDLSELEDWIAAGQPVALSLCYNKLRGRTGEPSGHLVVCVGFTENGDVVINDPGTRRNVQKIFPRAQVAHAWAHSQNAAYVVYPERMAPPRDRFGHWHSWSSNRNVRLN